MKVQSKVVALDYRTGVSSKDGKNKDRNFVSLHVLDYDGNVFDIFGWNDDNRFPKKADTPCLMDCMFEVGSGQEGKITFDLLQISRKSAAFDVGAVFENAKISLEKA
jgi:hypothetical protein